MSRDLEEKCASPLVLGCMGLGGDESMGFREAVDQAIAALDAAWESGIRQFDHADIYGGGRAESVFGAALKTRPDLREEMCLQSKCGIRPGRYDASKAHILESVECSLRRLGISCLDILLLHRPDPLMEPEEVAAAFVALKEAGKVLHFGVSNMNVPQMRLLQRMLPMPLVVNQLEMSLARLDWVDDGVLVNHPDGQAVQFPAGMLEHCALEGIRLQAWGPLGRGLFSGLPLDDAPEHVREAARRVSALAQEKDTTPEAVVLGWLMRHPARVQPVIGTTRAERIMACRDASRVAQELSREEWYSLYLAARGGPVP